MWSGRRRRRRREKKKKKEKERGKVKGGGIKDLMQLINSSCYSNKASDLLEKKKLTLYSTII